jgi:hypothetical protein
MSQPHHQGIHSKGCISTMRLLQVRWIGPSVVWLKDFHVKSNCRNRSLITTSDFLLNAAQLAYLRLRASSCCWVLLHADFWKNCSLLYLHGQIVSRTVPRKSVPEDIVTDYVMSRGRIMHSGTWCTIFKIKKRFGQKVYFTYVVGLHSEKLSSFYLVKKTYLEFTNEKGKMPSS